LRKDAAPTGKRPNCLGRGKMVRKDTCMKPKRCVVKNERGSTIVAALLILTLLTIIGIAAINSSITERATSANYLLYERVFFTAEAGLEHAKAALQNQLSSQLPLLATGQSPNFSSILMQVPDPATASFPTGYDLSLLSSATLPVGYKKYFGPAPVNSPLEGYQYNIYIWDNNDEPGPDDTIKAVTDKDSTIFMLAQAVGPKNSKCSIFAVLVADADKDALSGYSAQEGTGSGKGYSSLDKGKVEIKDNHNNVNIQVGRGGGLELH